MWWDCVIMFTIFLNLDAQENSCSAAMVLCFLVRTFSGLYFCWHCLSLWLRMCSLSMILVTNFQILFSGDGRGRSCWAAFSLSRWQMLSYEIIYFFIASSCSSGVIWAVSMYRTLTIWTNTCDGLSDLQSTKNTTLVNFQVSQYRTI